MPLHKMLTTPILKIRFRATPKKFYFALQQHNATTPLGHYSGTSSIFCYTVRPETCISAFRNKKKASEPRGWQTWQNNISVPLAKTSGGLTVSIREKHWCILHCLAFTGFCSVMNLPEKVRIREETEFCAGACNNIDRADSIVSS